MITRKKTLSFIALTTLAMSLPLVAQPALESIQAYLNPTLSFMVDGNDVELEHTPITYEDTTYLPIAEISRLIGKEVSYEYGTVIINTPTEYEENVMPLENITLDSAIIEEIYLVNRRVLISYEGVDPTTHETYQTLLELIIDDDSTIIHQIRKKMYYRRES